jgi:AcrR family transcriptional regulator
VSGGETPGPAVDLFVFAYCAGARVEEAARRAGISRATAYRLLRDPRVLESILQLRAEVRRRVVDRLVASQDLAVAQLVHHASAAVEPTAASSVTAARALLAEGRNWVEVEELRQRVDALEDRTVLPAAARPVVLELLERLDGQDDEPTPDP